MAAERPPAPLRTSHRTTSRRDDLIGAGFILLTSLQFGAVVVVGKVLAEHGDLAVPTVLAYRFAIAGAILAGALALMRRPLRPARGEALPLALLGAAGYGVEAGFFFAALEHGSAAAVTLLFFTYPVLVALIAFAAGKGLPGWLLGGALAAAVAGAAVVVVTGGGVDIRAAGIAFALGSAGTFALYLAGAEAVLSRTSALTGAMWVSVSAAAGLAAFAVATGSAQVPAGLDEWGPVLALAVFTAGAFVCLFAGLRRLGAVRTAILSATEPLTAAVLAAIFLEEAVRSGTVGGGALILVGAVAASLARGRRPVEPPTP